MLPGYNMRIYLNLPYIHEYKDVLNKVRNIPTYNYQILPQLFELSLSLVDEMHVNMRLE